jgi:prepilin signal peptidase PulO-like enzyme (type II secretory pathway)
MELLVFILGLIIGSFLNCVIYRIEKGESFFKGRSYCPNCRHVLGSLDLIPIFSFLFLKGRCRYCRKKISLQYPLIEMFTGLLFLLIFYFYYFSFQSFLLWFIFSLLAIVFVYDFKHYLIPDKVIYLAVVSACIFSFFFGHYQFLNYLLSAAGIFIVFYSMVILSRETWMGMGDAKLVFLMGMLLGWPNILIALFSAAFLGSLIGILMIIMKKKKINSQIPFGPFLVTGSVVSFFWGQEIINWYFNLFF